MRLALSLLILLTPCTALAQTDAAYCDKLYDYAVRYRGKAIMGEMKPTPDMIVAQNQCRNGRAGEGVATLERLLRNANITPPPR